MSRHTRARKNLPGVDKQLRKLRMDTISGPVEQRIAEAALLQAGVDAVLHLIQFALGAFAVFAALTAVPTSFDKFALLAIPALLAYLVISFFMSISRSRRIAVRAVLDHRINRAAAVHAARSGDACNDDGEGANL